MRHSHSEPEWADGDPVAVAQRAGRDSLAINQRAGLTLEIAKLQPAGSADDGAVERADVVDVESNLASGFPAEQCQWQSERPACPTQSAVLHYQLGLIRGKGASLLRQVGG